MTTRHWVFIAAKPFLPDAPDPFTAGLGGTEQAVINLTGALAGLGDRVTVAGGARTEHTLNGVTWCPGIPAGADLHVAINDATLLPAGSATPVVWFHNEVSLIKEIRRARLPALLRHRPAAVFIGTGQAKNASQLFPFRCRKVIPYGLSDRILAARATGALPPPHAMFTSQAYRGLRHVIAMWQQVIVPAVPGATLTAFIAEHDVPAYRALVSHPSITVMPRIGNDAIHERLRQTRVLLAPGHVSETFCLAAAEAIALGVPVVTLGIGSLKERVRDGIDGHVCRNFAGMGEQACRILLDEPHWRHLHVNGIATRSGQSWRKVAEKWQAL